MSMLDGAKTRVKVGSAFSGEFRIKVGVHQGSVLSPLDLIKKILCADDLVFMSETVEDLKERFWNCKEVRI